MGEEFGEGCGGRKEGGGEVEEGVEETDAACDGMVDFGQVELIFKAMRQV